MKCKSCGYKGVPASLEKNGDPRGNPFFDVWDRKSTGEIVYLCPKCKSLVYPNERRSMVVPFCFVAFCLLWFIMGFFKGWGFGDSTLLLLLFLPIYGISYLVALTYVSWKGIDNENLDKTKWWHLATSGMQRRISHGVAIGLTVIFASMILIMG